jgi:hypothetical protein
MLVFMSDRIIVAIEQLAERLETAIGDCEEKLLLIREAQAVVEEVKATLAQVIPQQDKAYRVLDRLRKEAPGWWTVTSTGYVAPENCANLKYWLMVLDTVGRQYAPDFIRHTHYDKKQHFIDAGEHLKAQQIVFNTMKRAKETLDIIDPYLDDTIFPYVESLEPGLKVRALAGKKPKPIVKAMHTAYAASASNLDIRTDATFHDRYIIVDGQEVWALGTSINNMGGKATTISKITDATEQARTLAAFQAIWAASAPL